VCRINLKLRGQIPNPRAHNLRLRAPVNRLAKDAPSTSLLLSLLRLLLSRLKDLPHIALASNPLLHLNIKLAKLLLLRIGLFEQRFFALLQSLSLVFQLLSRCVLVLNPRNGQVVFVTVRVLRVCGEEFFGCG
jgi:hypothetical protein